MTAEGHTCVSLTGGIEGAMRDEIIDKFRSGEAKVLITTNVLARGIDVSTVSMVINYVRLPIRFCLKISCCFPRLIDAPLSRIFQSSIIQRIPHARPTARLTFIVLAVPVALGVLAYRFRLLPTRKNGPCLWKFKNISPRKSFGLTLEIGMK